MPKTLKEHSRINYTSDSGHFEAINAGSLQRIADAMELTAKNYLQMQNDLDWHKRRKQQLEERVAHLEKQNAAYRGVINRMKKKKQ